MSDPRYPDRLERLFTEFEESYLYQHLPQSQWPFKSFESLLRGTPAFWEHFVQRKLNEECGGVWRYLECPLTGKNPYMDSLASNLAKILEMISGLADLSAANEHIPSAQSIKQANTTSCTEIDGARKPPVPAGISSQSSVCNTRSLLR
jgi:hypothetical protein